jgi:hypothetical protein
MLGHRKVNYPKINNVSWFREMGIQTTLSAGQQHTWRNTWRIRGENQRFAFADLEHPFALGNINRG